MFKERYALPKLTTIIACLCLVIGLSLSACSSEEPILPPDVAERIEEKLGEEKLIELLEPCLHGRPPDDFEGDRKDYKELGIGGFLKKKHQKLLQNFEKNRDEGTYSFAQPVDEEVVDYIRSTPTVGAGVREGDVIFVTKIPYQTKKYLKAKDDKMKRYHYCYCPWVRGAIKAGTENEIFTHFCYCSAGYTKKYWDVIFDQPTIVEPIETPLTGGTLCTIQIHGNGSKVRHPAADFVDKSRSHGTEKRGALRATHDGLDQRSEFGTLVASPCQEPSRGGHRFRGRCRD